MADNIDQKIKGNDNIQQNIATQNITIVNSEVSEEKIREISAKNAKDISKEFFALSQDLANKRMKDFEDVVLNRLNKIENGLAEFQDPSFVYAYRKAQIQSAMTDEKSSYAMLNELLMHRKDKKENRYSVTGVDGAIEIVNQISDSTLEALTIMNCISMCVVPMTNDLEEGLKILNNLYESIILEELPDNYMWLDQLDVLKAIRINNLVKFDTFESIMSKQFSGYSSAGIKEGSAEFKRAIKFQNECKINVLIKNPVLENYYIVPVFEKGQVENFCRNIAGDSIPLSTKEKECIYKIIDLYTTDTDANSKAMKNFIDKMDGYSAIKKIHIWWNKIPNSCEITTIGRVLGHANAQKCFPGFPPLD